MFLIFVGVILLFGFIYYRLHQSTKFWENKNVKCQPANILVGNIGSSLIRKKHIIQIISDIYNKHPNERYVGYMHFTKPVLMLRDINLIKQLAVKDFDHFHDRFGSMYTDDKNPASKSLLNLAGEEWRQMRATISPAFTSNKLKNMYPLIADCAINFVQSFRGKEAVAVEMKDLLSRFTIDTIASTAFAIEINSVKNPNNTFYQMSKSFHSFGIFHLFKILIATLSMPLAKILRIQFTPRTISKYFPAIIEDNINQREQKGNIRQDLIQLLVEAKNNKLSVENDQKIKFEGFASTEEFNLNSKKLQLTNEHIIGQALLFFVAGYNTVSTASSFMAYELALNPDIQKKLQNEIDAVNVDTDGNVSVTYEKLLSMKYLDQVVSETLRKWPPVFSLDRLCTKDYVILGTSEDHKEIQINKGISVSIPVMAIHRDPKYYNEPTRFDPERFSETNRNKIISGAYLPFGVGPRNCIGSRFALLEIKTLFFHLLSKFEILAINATQIPLTISPSNIDLAPKNGFRLSLQPRKKL